MPEDLKGAGEAGIPSEVERIAPWIFIGAGGLMLAGGLALAIDEPAGFGLAAFGAVFIGAGLLVRRLMKAVSGKKWVTVSEVQGAHRSSSVQIAVDPNATEQEIAAARQAWFDEQFRARPDWVSGQVAEDMTHDWRLFLAICGVGWVVALAFLSSAVSSGDWFTGALAGPISIALAAQGGRLLWHQRKFGASQLVLKNTPLYRGESFLGEVRTGVRLGHGQMPAAPLLFRLELTCVHRWQQTRGSGNNRTTESRHEVLWQHRVESPGEPQATADGSPPCFVVSVAFDLPKDLPCTKRGQDGFDWELAVHAELPGLDYRTRFTLPVFDR